MLIKSLLVAYSLLRVFKLVLNINKGGTRMIRYLVGLILGLFLIFLLGSLLLENFPAAQPLWEEVREHLANFYNAMVVKYGPLTTLFIFWHFLIILFGSL